MKQLILYYQTFISLKPLFDNNALPTHIQISSIHFGKNENNIPYIHLNDHPPNSSIFDSMWKEIETAHNLGIKIKLMIGGAGLAFQEMFSNFDLYYEMLKTVLKFYPYICGVDLDIEENVDLNNVIKLVNALKTDFGNDFLISFAPVAFALQQNQPGLGGFLYNDLINILGDKIENLNTQFYYDFSVESYNEVIQNKYNPSQIILGMTQNNTNEFKIVSDLCKKYKNFKGIFFWELVLLDNPIDWIKKMKNILEE